MPKCLAPTSNSAILRNRYGTWTRAELAGMAKAVAGTLPQAAAALNLCEERDGFLVGFMAMLMRRQVCLLPPSRAQAVVAEVAAEHPDCHRLDDASVAGFREHPGNPSGPWPEVEDERVVVVGYTSGSTGRARPFPKTWGIFQATAHCNAASLHTALGHVWRGRMPWILATVPAQHMYGFEMTVVLPLFGHAAVHAAHPLYPADIAASLAELPEPRVLVTTPVHLRALMESGVELPGLAAVVSATAPLSGDLAIAVERRFRTVLLEFFGSTETCVIASRRPAVESTWRLHPGILVEPQAIGTLVHAPWFDEPVLLQDMLEPRAGDGFVVQGRSADLVEVGGKRASLADLTLRLLAVPGVTDAVVFQPEGPPGATIQRLAALVVAPDRTQAEILAALAFTMDPVFLPRPLVSVASLPRNEVGKLPLERLLAAIRG